MLLPRLNLRKRISSYVNACDMNISVFWEGGQISEGGTNFLGNMSLGKTYFLEICPRGGHFSVTLGAILAA